MKKFNILVITTNRADWQHVAAMLNELSHMFHCTLLSVGNNETIEDKQVRHWALSKKIRIIKNPNESKNQNLASTIEQIPNTMAMLGEQKIDLALVFGDRFEMLIIALWLFQSNIKIAHIGGGETSLGSLDEKYRSLITQIASYHFPLTEAAKRKLESVGVASNSIYRIGAPSLDQVATFSNDQVTLVLKNYRLEFKKYILLTYHTPTGDQSEILGMLSFYYELIIALSLKYSVVITESNLEDLGLNLREIAKKITDLPHNTNVKYLEGFNGNEYSALMRGASVCLGNSSSGLYEAPVHGTPSINIGNRQSGRVHGPSVFDVSPEVTTILDLIEEVSSIDSQKIDYGNPYFLPNSSNKLTTCLTQILSQAN